MDLVVIDAGSGKPWDAYRAVGDVGIEQICGRIRVALKATQGPRLVSVEGWHQGKQILNRVVANPSTAVVNRVTSAT